MKVNYKQMYLMLKQQEKVLNNQIAPNTTFEKVNEVPENFNQIGWDLTIEKMEQLLEKMKDVRVIKGKRLTPQFYRSILNRALIGINEINKLQETISADVDDSMNYELECIKLTAEINQLNIQAAAATEIAARAVVAAAATAAAAETAKKAEQLNSPK